jgi:hypothetical protein
MEREIGRITFEGIGYVLGVTLFDIGDERIPYPWISVTTKSAKKKREKKLGDKHDIHFNRIEVKNPVGLYKKVYEMFDKFLKDYQFICFSANSDSREKREVVYQRSLEKMGFKLIYIFEKSWRDRVFIMARNEKSLKKKDLKRIIDNIGA